MSKPGNRKAAVSIMVLAVFAFTRPAWAADRAGVVQGVVKNSSREPVSGAFVKLRNSAKHLTFMVISQAQGHYKATNLPDGKYVVQGVGNGFQSEPSAPVEVVAGRAATVDLSLTASRAPMLPGGWPGTPGILSEGRISYAVPNAAKEAAEAALRSLPEGGGKNIISTKCTVCHDAVRIGNSRTRDEWQAIVGRMREYIHGNPAAKELTDPDAKVLLEYLGANFSSEGAEAANAQPDPNSRLPRTLLQGEATKYIAVDYDLETSKGTHDVTVDSMGNGWFSQTDGGRLGRLDLKTLAYTEVSPPTAASKPRLTALHGDGSGDKFWMVDYRNGRWLNYDAKTGEFNAFVAPKPKYGAIQTNTMRVQPNGNVWATYNNINQIVGLNPATKKFVSYDVPAGGKAGVNAFPYGMAISGDGKIWFAEHQMELMGRLDPATGKIDEFPIPWQGEPSFPRRMDTDADGNLWVGLHRVGKLMKIDYKTTKMTVYSPPTEKSGAYSVSVDRKNNRIWVNQQMVDQIARFDPQTETFVEFPLPYAETDVRRVEVDPKNPNRIWWSGFHSAHIGYIEVLD